MLLYCRADVTIFSLMEVLLAASRMCPACKREILIQNGKAIRTTGEAEKKPPKQVRARVSKAQNG